MNKNIFIIHSLNGDNEILPYIPTPETMDKEPIFLLINN